MREKPCLNISVSCNAIYTSILILLFYILFTSVITTNVDAQEENTLEIYLFDPSDSSYEPMESNIFLEGKEYEIVVWNGTGYAYNATVVVPWNSYVTTVESPSIMIQAPSYEEYSQFVIIASKDGYIPAEKFVTVIKGRLEIVPDQMIVNEKEDFSVLVTDQDGNKISGSSVYIVKEPKGDSDLTNEAGVAYLSAPDVESDEENKTMADSYLYSLNLSSRHRFDELSLRPFAFLSWRQTDNVVSEGIDKVKTLRFGVDGDLGIHNFGVNAEIVDTLVYSGIDSIAVRTQGYYEWKIGDVNLKGFEIKDLAFKVSVDVNDYVFRLDEPDDQDYREKRMICSIRMKI